MAKLEILQADYNTLSRTVVRLKCLDVLGETPKRFWGGEKRLMNGHKKRSSAELQPFVNLKSNTMKNTLQRYVFSGSLQAKCPEKSV